MSWEVGIDIYTLLCIKWASLMVQQESSHNAEDAGHTGDVGSIPR